MNFIKTTTYRFKKFITGISFEKPYLKRWLRQMILHGAFILQGLLGIMTLTLFTRNLTARPSGKLALQSSVCHEYKKFKAAQAIAEKEGTTCEMVDPTTPESLDDEMDDFVERMLNNEKKSATSR